MGSAPIAAQMLYQGKIQHPGLSISKDRRVIPLFGRQNHCSGDSRLQLHRTVIRQNDEFLRCNDIENTLALCRQKAGHDAPKCPNADSVNLG